MFPELGERVMEAGNDKMRIKHCPRYTSKYYDSTEYDSILVYEIHGLSSPECIVSTCKKVTEKVPLSKHHGARSNGFSVILFDYRIDNSEWMRNGDYTPSRLEAQSDAVTFLFNAKTQSNPENTVGLISMAGKSPSVLVTLTSDIGKVLTSLHHVQVQGTCQINTSVQIAQLVLKHRQNKNQRQRIIVFVASPIEEEESSLVKLGKKLKKNNVAIDVISFGQEQENEAKLSAFIEAVNNNDNSHLVSIPPGPHLLSDVLLSSPIICGEDGPPPGFGGNFEFGVDPNLDPELAMVLKMSMEEERARQEKLTGPSEKAVIKETSPEDAELAAALAMSMGQDSNEVEMTEDEEMARALALSMENNQIDLDNVIGNLPGVDPNDPRLQSAIKDGDKKKSKEEEKKK